MFVSEAGRLTVYLTNPSAQQEGAKAVLSQLQPLTKALERARNVAREYDQKDLSGLSVSNLEAVEGDYAFGRLYVWHQQATKQILGEQGVYSTDILEAENRLRIGVADDAVMRSVEKRLTDLGIPVEAAIIEVEQPRVFLAGTSASSMDLPPWWKSSSLRTSWRNYGFGAGIQIGYGSNSLTQVVTYASVAAIVENGDVQAPC